MKPAELNALRARFPELQRVATGQVAGGFSQAAAAQPSGPRTFAITGPDGTTFNVNVRANASPAEVETAVRLAGSGRDAE